jgi:hypothetical protein
MSGTVTRRIMVVLLFSAVIAYGIQHDYSHWRLLGKDAFMLSQSQRFDKVMANPKISESVAEGILIGLVFVAYELVVFVVYAISRAITMTRNRRQPVTPLQPQLL